MFKSWLVKFRAGVGLILLFFGLLSPRLLLASYQLKPCETAVVQLAAGGEKLLKYRRVAPELLKRQDFRYLPGNVARFLKTGFNLAPVKSSVRDEVIVGIESPSHFFLILGNHRLDPRILNKAHLSWMKKKFPVGAGMFLRLNNISPQQIWRLRQAMFNLHERVTITCSQGTLHVLADAGLHIGDGLPASLFPSENLRRILVHGFMDDQLRKIDFEIILATEDNIETILEKARAMDDRFSRALWEKFKGRTEEEIRRILRTDHNPQAEQFAPTILKFTADQAVPVPSSIGH